jgi:uncharacterized protein YbjT (DUF2867 family)
MTRILVTGATGNTGLGLVPALRNAGVEVRAFVRNEAKAQPLKDAGAEVVVGDLNKPETIAPAVAGVDKIYLLTWNGPTQLQQVRNVLTVAQQNGSPHIVRQSMWGPERSRIITQGDQAEAELKSSGLPWTLLKPTFFMQNFMMAAQTIRSEGKIYWDLGKGRLGMIDVRDIVDSAVAALTQRGHESKSFILTGPDAVSLYDVAGVFTKVLGKEVQYVNVPSEVARGAMVSMGVPEWIADGYGELMQGFSEGFANSTTGNVKTLTGHSPRSIEEFVRDYAEAFGRTQREPQPEHAAPAR